MLVSPPKGGSPESEEEGRGYGMGEGAGPWPWESFGGWRGEEARLQERPLYGKKWGEWLEGQGGVQKSRSGMLC